MTAPAGDPLARYPIVVEFPIAWGDLDALGHVNNTVYFRLFESARIAYLDAIGLVASAGPSGVGPILASTGCRFRRPLGFPDTVRVGARVPELREDRFTMEYVVFSEALDDVAASGEGVVVAYDYGAGSKVPVPDAVVRAIERLEGDVATAAAS